MYLQNRQSVETVLELAFEALYSLVLMHCALRRVQIETLKLQDRPGCRNCKGGMESKLHGRDNGAPELVN